MSSMTSGETIGKGASMENSASKGLQEINYHLREVYDELKVKHDEISVLRDRVSNLEDYRIIFNWIETRIKDMVDTNSMWGSEESIQKQMEVLNEFTNLIQGNRGLRSVYLRSMIIKWVSVRVDGMLKDPTRFGYGESFELVMILLFEIWGLGSMPKSLSNDPRKIIDKYSEFLRRVFPDKRKALHELAACHLGCFILEQFFGKSFCHNTDRMLLVVRKPMSKPILFAFLVERLRAEVARKHPEVVWEIGKFLRNGPFRFY